MKREWHKDDRFQGDHSERKIKSRVGEQRQAHYRAEMVYSADCKSVLEMFSSQLRMDKG